MTDDGTPPLSAEQTFAATVNEVNTAPKLSVINSQSVEAGRELAFAATGTDPDLPPNVLTFTLGPGTPDGAKISSTGAFTWTPTEAQGGASYPIGITVTEDGAPPLSDSETLDVTVSAVQRKTRVMEATLSTDGKFSFFWSAQPGRVYRVQFKDRLSDVEWKDLDPTIVATGDSAKFAASVSEAAQRFYRVVSTVP